MGQWSIHEKLRPSKLGALDALVVARSCSLAPHRRTKRRRRVARGEGNGGERGEKESLTLTLALEVVVRGASE